VARNEKTSLHGIIAVVVVIVVDLVVVVVLILNVSIGWQAHSL
jgi:hypothetical protein